MKKRFPYIIVVLFVIIFTSCEDFRDNNGDLGGQWQLTQWRTRSSSGEIDSLVATNIVADPTVANHYNLYFSIHRDVLLIQEVSTSFFNINYFFSITLTDNMIKLGDVVDKDGKVPGPMENSKDFTPLAEFAVPADGCYSIDKLSDDYLQLSFKDNILCFRKY